jgi:hypothetical protein
MYFNGHECSARFELQKNEAKQLRRLSRAQKPYSAAGRMMFSPPPSLRAPVEHPLAAMEGIRVSRQAAVGAMQDQSRREPQRRF